jgi:hypothetical protein
MAMENRVKEHWPEDRRFYEQLHHTGQAINVQEDRPKQSRNKQPYGVQTDHTTGIKHNINLRKVDRSSSGESAVTNRLQLQQNEAYEPGIGKYRLSGTELRRYGVENPEQYRNYNQQERKMNWSNYARPDYKPDNHISSPNLTSKDSD